MEPNEAASTGFQMMSTAAVNSASAHRQMSKKHIDGKKTKTVVPHGVAAMQSLINDESILLSYQGNVAKHNSLIVDSLNQNLNGEVNILS